ncbi:MAG: DUF4143 domain-containing protein [Proteiniphilum sp.]|uniref:DUF4143 domain-containing protein n=1 Tax=Proteiniphilum sp. TaxID=1926877 RepID=UPI002AB88956|nr:DUF4143 domain-containing protein [Proteiniphilum sp.]MDY9917532.1 DUF4143 domain-containing protein [Proteiniphilum sp.]
MERAFLLELVYPATSVQVPIEVSFRRAPKLCWVDTGLVNFTAKGTIAEQIVAQELRVLLNNAHIEHLNFWIRNKKGSNAEVDFIWQQGTHIIPIEVKSGTNAHLRSIQSFMDLSAGNTAVRIWSEKYSVDTARTPKGKSFKLLNIPFYYAGALPMLLGREM